MRKRLAILIVLLLECRNNALPKKSIGIILLQVHRDFLQSRCAKLYPATTSAMTQKVSIDLLLETNMYSGFFVLTHCNYFKKKQIPNYIYIYSKSSSLVRILKS